MDRPRYRIESIRAEPLAVPLVEPFVIATARVEATPNVLVCVEVVDLDTATRATGTGEAATLRPVTSEGPEDVLAFLRDRWVSETPTHSWNDPAHAEQLIDALADGTEHPCARAGLSVAIADAWATLRHVPLGAGWDGFVTGATFETDVTLPIVEPAHRARLAERWARQGFRAFKVKVGRDAEEDLRALEAIHRAVPGARLRLDANGGLDADAAIRLVEEALRLGVTIECFEQPCARDDLDGLARCTEALSVDVVADESCRNRADLDRLVARKAVDGINLKLAKTGSIDAVVALGRAARAAGLSLMVGEMVETRLGTTAALHVAAALGGVDWLDLDTPLLLDGDPFTGGYTLSDARLMLVAEAGHGVSRATR